MRLFNSLFIMGFIGCSSETAEKEAAGDQIILHSARGQLIRLSIDLRGVMPTSDELNAIETSPELYGEFVDRYLNDPRFLERVRQIFNQKILTRTGSTYGYMADGFSNTEVAQAIGDEALQLISYVVENDLPYTEILTANYTMANPALAHTWDLDYPLGESGWRPATYKDFRPHSGVLTMNSVWHRYPSEGGNANRHRANAVSKMFLCDDYLARPVVLNRSAVDQLTTDPENAINSNPACQSCHSTLDPLASHFYGFFPLDEDESIATYRPEREENWRMYSGKDPAYFGTPTANLTELGERLAEDERFVDCTVKTVMEGLGQRDITDADWTEFQEQRQAFVNSELSVRHLIRSIVNSDIYKVKTIEDDDLAERIPTIKVVNPHQLSAIIEDITQFKWTFGGIDGLTNIGMGIPVLLGGLDSGTVTKRNYMPSVGLAFVQERLAQAAGWSVASHDLDAERDGDAILLHYVTIEDSPETAPDAFDHQLRYLYERSLGYPLAEDATEPKELMTLWDQLYSIKASPTQAWAGVISAILRDPAIITY